MKYRIEIIGKSGECDDIQEAQYIECGDDFLDYIDNFKWKDKLDFEEGGIMTFFIKDNELYTKTTYYSKEELTTEELKELIDYTQGQWSDGIGEGFEQEPFMINNVTEYYVSPWYYGQIVYSNQESL